MPSLLPRQALIVGNTGRHIELLYTKSRYRTTGRKKSINLKVVIGSLRHTSDSTEEYLYTGTVITGKAMTKTYGHGFSSDIL